MFCVNYMRILRKIKKLTRHPPHRCRAYKILTNRRDFVTAQKFCQRQLFAYFSKALKAVILSSSQGLSIRSTVY